MKKKPSFEGDFRAAYNILFAFHAQRKFSTVCSLTVRISVFPFDILRGFAQVQIIIRGH